MSLEQQKRGNCDSRLHIGHSFITHSYLLMGEEPPTCFGCDEQILHIEHILLTYSDFIEMRENHFTAQSLHVLFEKNSMEQTFNYLKAKYF